MADGPVILVNVPFDLVGSQHDQVLRFMVHQASPPVYGLNTSTLCPLSQISLALHSCLCFKLATSSFYVQNTTIGTPSVTNCVMFFGLSEN